MAGNSPEMQGRGSRGVRAYQEGRRVEANAMEGLRWLQAASFLRYCSLELLLAPVAPAVVVLVVLVQGERTGEG